MMTEEKFNYEKALLRIKEISSLVERSDLSLDELSIITKEAKELILKCKSKLREIEEELT